MKKLLYLAFASALLMGLAACDNEEEPQKEGPQKEEQGGQQEEQQQGGNQGGGQEASFDLDNISLDESHWEIVSFDILSGSFNANGGWNSYVASDWTPGSKVYFRAEGHKVFIQRSDDDQSTFYEDWAFAEGALSIGNMNDYTMDGNPTFTMDKTYVYMMWDAYLGGGGDPHIRLNAKCTIASLQN